jgi:hypothetical protein
MKSIVLELQRDALNPNFKASDLLRKTLVVAKKLKLAELEEWINKELNGYNTGNAIPDYRLSVGKPKAWNTQVGWKDIIFTDSEAAKLASQRFNGQSIAEIENLINNACTDSFFIMPYTIEVENHLRKAISFQTKITLFVSQSESIKILNGVRNTILNWTLKLEENGILGEEITFSQEEKAVVSSQEYNINNFFEKIEQTQIVQQSSVELVDFNLSKIDSENFRNFIEDLDESLNKIKTNTDDMNELKSEIETIKSQIISPRPKSNIIKESLKTTKKILESASGNIAAKILIELSKYI